MKKIIIMILASGVMLASMGLGFVNKKTFDQGKENLDGLLAEAKKKTEYLDGKEAELGEAETRIGQATDTKNQLAAAVEEEKGSVMQAERKVEDLGGEIKKVEIEQKEIDLLVKRQFPDGVIRTVEDLQSDVDARKEKLAEEQAKKQELLAEVGTANQEKQLQVARVRDEEQAQVTRAQLLAAKGLVATVIAVNEEWGFVMVNAGSQHGVTADKTLLVKRGNSRVARLRIVNLQDTSIVANVVAESLVPGINVQPGDKVILE